jgi:sugar phosphate permease
VISHWFDKRRGLALGLAAIGVGLSTFLMPSLAYGLTALAGWRGGYTILGLTVIVVTVPVIALFLVDKPQIMGLLPDGDVDADAHHLEPKKVIEVHGMTAGETLRTGTFWVLFVAFLLIGISVVGCLIHLVPLLTDRGVSAQTAAFATSVLGAAVIFGRVASGYLLDRIFASYVALIFFFGAAVGVLVVSRYFGLRAYAEIYGYVLISFALGGVVGPLLMGFSFDRTGSYNIALGVFLFATLLGAALMTRLGPYRVWKSSVEAAPV